MALPNRCPTCGREVASFFDHIDASCDEWPDRDVKPYGEGSIEYKGFAISNAWIGGFQYVHNDYDGPEDNRHGHEATLEDCYRAIDEWHDENA